MIRPIFRMEKCAWVVDFPDGASEECATRGDALALIQAWAAVHKCRYAGCWQSAEEKLFDWGPRFCPRHARNARKVLHLPAAQNTRKATP